jgi:general secretion pathway protein N
MFGWATTRRVGSVIQFTLMVSAVGSGVVDALIASPPMARAADRVPEHSASADRQAAPGNPLWQVPLASLKVTQERPLFSLTRRPPPRAVVALPMQPSLPPPPAQPPEPDQPPLSLIGTILQDNAGIAFFQSGNTEGIIRLKIGESYAGWSLAALKPREATFNNGHRHTTLGFPLLATRQAPAILPAAGPAPTWLGGAKVTAVSPRSSVPSGPAPTWLNGAPVSAVSPNR